MLGVGGGLTRSLALVAVVSGGTVLAGCGAGAAPSTTIAGVGVPTSGPPPKASTPATCTRRWNGAANAPGRAVVKQRAPKTTTASVRTAGRSGYFADDAGRCLVYVIAPSESAVVLAEAAPGKFAFTADASGRFSANADLRADARLRLP
jgi:hypothetical protein